MSQRKPHNASGRFLSWIKNLSRPSGKSATKQNRSRSLRIEGLEGRDLMATVVLDTSFSGDGIASYSGIIDSPSGPVAFTSDNKILIAGTELSGASQFRVTRLNSNGSVDTTFGSQGTTSLSFSDSFIAARAIAVQPQDGKIIVAGDNGGSFVVARFTANGTVDKTFNTTGSIKVPVDDFVNARAIAVQSNGSIIVVGVAEDFDGSQSSNFAVARFTSAGKVDSTFNVGKVKQIDFSGESDYGLGVRVESGGKILIGGESGDRLASVRLTSTGAADTSYGPGGKKLEGELKEPSGFRGNDLFLTGTSVLVPGYQTINGRKHFAIVKGLTTTGAVDPKFDGDGLVTTAIGSTHAEARRLAIQSDGKLVVTGTSSLGFTIARYGMAPTINSFGVPATGIVQRNIAMTSKAYTKTTSNLVDNYSWFVSGPVGFTSVSSTAQNFTFKPTVVGAYTVRLTARDAVGVATVRTQTINVISNAPTITAFNVPTTGVEERVYNFSAAATNAGGTTPTQNYAWTITGPNGFTETHTTAEASFTPPTIGTYTLSLTASDSLGGSVTRTQTINVIDNAPNIPRFIVPATAVEGANFVLTATAFEAGSTTTHVAAYEWRVTGPSYDQTFNTQRVVLRFPDNGAYNAVLVVTDQFGETNTKSAAVSVANAPPIIKAMVIPTSARIVQAVNLASRAIDPAGTRDTLKYTWVITGPSNYRKVLNGAAPVWTSHFLTGTYTVKLMVADEDGGLATLTKTLKLTV